MRGVHDSKSCLIVCECGYLVSYHKYKTHLKTALHANKMSNPQVVCSCGLTYSTWSSTKMSHMRSIKHSQMLDASVKKIPYTEYRVPKRNCIQQE